MSKAPVPIVEQAQRLAASALMLPVDDAATVLEHAITVLQAAQAQVLVAGERSGELAAASGCATVRSFAMSILRRSAGDASAMAGVAVHLVAFPKLAAAYAAGVVHTPNLRTIIRHLPASGLGVLQEHEDALVELATGAGPAEVAVFCQALAEVHRPDGDQAKVRAAGLRSVRITPVGDLAHLDAMLDPRRGRPPQSHTQGVPGRDRPRHPHPRRRPRRLPHPRGTHRRRPRTPPATRHGVCRAAREARRPAGAGHGDRGAGDPARPARPRPSSAGPVRADPHHHRPTADL
jgi:hypothetical protein